MILIYASTALLATIIGIISINGAFAQDTNYKVAAGGGNFTVPLDIYTPKNLEIKVGQNVTWYNPSKVAEPHTVTFVLDPNMITGIGSPFAILNTTKFSPLPPGSNSEPILIPGKNGTNTLIAVNARVFNPVAIDSHDKVQFINPNANYEVVGTEKYINSGWLLPTGLEKQYPGSGNTFTLTFKSSGTYGYLCILHPWMTGSITVK